MAVAYSRIIIDGCSIHLTELSSTPTTNYTTNGWTNNVQVKVYGFCAIDTNGVPDLTSPGAFSWTVTDPSPAPPGTPTLPGVSPTPAPATAGLCKPFTAPDNLVVGNDAGGGGRAVYLAVSVAIGRQALIPDPQWGPGSLHSRTISVTLHGRGERVVDMSNNIP